MKSKTKGETHVNKISPHSAAVWQIEKTNYQYPTNDT